MPLRMVFCGTPAFALPSLKLLIAQPEFHVEAVVTQPDRPRGRGQETSSSAVKDAALGAEIAVYQPERIKSESAFDFFRRVAPDVVVIIAYGQIIPARLIEMPRFGWINLHASLLPKYRGAAPINWAILNGEKVTGVTTMQIDAGLDTGPILLQRQMDVDARVTAPELYAQLADAGAPLMVETLQKLTRGEIQPRPQDNSAATLAPPLKKEDGRIEWNQEAHKIHNRIRAMQPWPGTFTLFRGKHCGIWGEPATRGEASSAPGALVASGNDLLVACGEGTWLQLEFVQVEGRKRVTPREFANGARLRAGERFGE